MHDATTNYQLIRIAQSDECERQPISAAGWLVLLIIACAGFSAGCHLVMLCY